MLQGTEDAIVNAAVPTAVKHSFDTAAGGAELRIEMLKGFGHAFDPAPEVPTRLFGVAFPHVARHFFQ